MISTEVVWSLCCGSVYHRRATRVQNVTDIFYVHWNVAIVIQQHIISIHELWMLSLFLHDFLLLLQNLRMYDV